jgi:hypothetical protein
MPINNPFQNPAFGMASLTAAINLLPNRYGRLEELGLFNPKPVRTRTIVVEEKAGVLTLLPSLPPGSPGTVGVRGKRTLRSFVIPHIPHDDVVLPEEVQGLRAFGTESEFASIAAVLAEHLETMRTKHAATLEYLRMGALKGIVFDADGRELVNLYDEFKIGAQSINFKLNVEGTNVLEKCLDLKRLMGKSLAGERMSSIQCLVSPEFFTKLVTHASVKEAYKLWNEGQALRSDMRAGFPFAGITFEEYAGEASTSDGNGGWVTKRFINEGEGHAFPLGTLDTFATYFAPADFNETVNTLGQPLYAKQEPRRFDRGTDLHTQSNPLPICQRPGLLIRLTMS